MKKQLAILGSTGSIGTQTLEVVKANPDRFEVYLLTANNNADLLISQARMFVPEMVVIVNEKKYPEVREALEDLPIKVWAGADAITQAVQHPDIDVVVTAMVGYSGLQPTVSAIKAGKAIALANKETLVVAGELITRLAVENKAPILPVDSEHSAIFQCIVGERSDDVEKLVLTASGGPFRQHEAGQLERVTHQEALLHPNWKMGAKITIDSASLMNKGFEMIEAKWLFGIDPAAIEVVVHPQSVIHSMVQFTDGSVKAQLGMPDMKIPIQYALSFPERIKNDLPRVDFLTSNNLTFEKPDTGRFPNLRLAYEAIGQGGNMPCVLNAANEIVVEAFLRDQISFTAMSRVIEAVMDKAPFVAHPRYDDFVATDGQARRIAMEMI